MIIQNGFDREEHDGTLHAKNVSIVGGSLSVTGQVTVYARNAGTTKTLATLPITLSTSSVATIAVPTASNTMYITNVFVSSDATVRVSIKAGPTYLSGNASIGISVVPGGGFVDSGSPDSPAYIGIPTGAIVIEKFDMTSTKSNVGGKVTYFQE